MSASVVTRKVSQAMEITIGLILILLPFHAFFTTWAGSNFNHLDLFRIWKELLLIPLCIVALWLVYQDKKLKQNFFSSKLVLLIVAYVLWQLALSFWAYANDNVNASALIYGGLNNLRFSLFFLVCYVVAFKSVWLYKHWPQLLLGPAFIVVTFGLLQKLILSPDFLVHFGYGPETIPAYHTIDQKADYIRVQSTLRGPNPLGAYLVLIITALTGLMVKLGKKNLIYITVVVVAVLSFTYSRSAWLGLLVALVILIFWLVQNKKTRMNLTYLMLACLAIFAITIFLYRNNDLIQNTIFHTDETSISERSSNTVRTQAITEGLNDIVNEPLGRGVGTAGPASVRNSKSPRIAENYFIQIGQEVGLIGLALFITINIMVGWQLWQRHSNLLAQILLASLIGITVINMLSHAWADDTLALIWWGWAGVAVGTAILNTNTVGKDNGKTQKASKT